MIEMGGTRVDVNKMARMGVGQAKPARLQWSIRLSWLSLAGLLLLFTWRSLMADDGSWLRWLVQCLPLAIFIPGLLHNSYRTYSWLCFVVLLYLIPAITQVVMSLGFRNAEQPPSHWSDWLLLILVVILFFSAVLNSRWLQRWQLQTEMRKVDGQ